MGARPARAPLTLVPKVQYGAPVLDSTSRRRMEAQSRERSTRARKAILQDELRGTLALAKDVSYEHEEPVSVIHEEGKLAGRSNAVNLLQIKQVVSEITNVSLAHIDCDRRALEYARPRQTAMYLCKRFTSLSLPRIGKNFGNRNHTTVINAIRKIGKLRKAGNLEIEGWIKTACDRLGIPVPSL